MRFFLLKRSLFIKTREARKGNLTSRVKGNIPGFRFPPTRFYLSVRSPKIFRFGAPKAASLSTSEFQNFT
jgi:hypothetical protein